MNTYTPYSTCIHTPLEHSVQVTASVLCTGQATICVSGWLCMLNSIETQMKDGQTTHSNSFSSLWESPFPTFVSLVSRLSLVDFLFLSRKSVVRCLSVGIQPLSTVCLGIAGRFLSLLPAFYRDQASYFCHIIIFISLPARCLATLRRSCRATISSLHQFVCLSRHRICATPPAQFDPSSWSWRIDLL